VTLAFARVKNPLYGGSHSLLEGVGQWNTRSVQKAMKLEQVGKVSFGYMTLLVENCCAELFEKPFFGLWVEMAERALLIIFD
jgi:hypothetical protein